MVASLRELCIAKGGGGIADSVTGIFNVDDYRGSFVEENAAKIHVM